MRTFSFGLTCLVLTCALSACGGGGGGGGTTGGTTTGGGGQVSQADAVRFLEQSSFGPTTASLAQVQQTGFSAYLDQQFAQPATGYPGYSYLDPNNNIGCPTGAPANCLRDNYTVFPLQAQFFRNAITGPDQLRQRVALALSQIMVISGLEINQPYAMAAYQQMLLNDAFGNFRTLLNDVTLSPAMGAYLNMVNNNKPNAAKGTSANENYARELLQLFSIGLVELNPDGTAKLDSQNQPIPTYDQTVVDGFARVYTGWTYPPLPGSTAKWTDPEYDLGQMVPIESHHDSDSKQILDGATIPAGGTAEADLKIALDDIFQHPNVAPFISKQLIMHLVTSNPSPAYVQRVAAVFSNDGQGVRGDLPAVVRAVLLDAEARGDVKTDASYGKLREPMLFIAGLLRSVGGSSDGVYLAAQSAAMEENVFTAPSVFNFYPPNYPLTGTALVAPSFGIYDATSSLNRANFVNAVMAGPIPPLASVQNATGTQLDLSSWQGVAADPAALAAQINAVFFHGAMPSQMQTALVQSLNAVPASDTVDRAKDALYLALTSGQFQVEQ